MSPAGWLLAAIGVPVGGLAYAALIGLGVGRHGDAIAVAAASSVLLFGPPMASAMTTWMRRSTVFLGVLAVWSALLLVGMPVFFPGERREAVSTGLAVLMGLGGDDHLARTLADQLPDEPELAVAQLPSAREGAEHTPPPPGPLADHEIALPFEGEGRRLSVPVVFEHQGRTIETFMMLDTGATYTTLPDSVLQQLGAMPAEGAPKLTLNTANGERRAKVVLLDRVWLGDLQLGGVAVTTCEDCASSDNAGLLGLNVAGGYNVTIDADRREVVFAARQSFNRRLDIRPFSEIEGRFTRYPGGRIELSLQLKNLAPRPIGGASVRVACGDDAWFVDLDPVDATATADVRRRLPRHEPCPTYEISLDSAWW